MGQVQIPQNAIWHQVRASEQFQHRFDQALESLSRIYAFADDALVTAKGKILSEAIRNYD